MLITEVSRRASYSRDSISIVRVMDVEPYYMHGIVASNLLGGINYVGGRLVRTLPFRDPHISWCWVKSVEVEGVGNFIGSGGTSDMSIFNVWNNGYSKARMTVTYETLEQTQQEMDNSAGPSTTDFEEIELASATYDIGAQQLTLPNDRYQWANSPTIGIAQSGTAGQKTIPKMDIAMVRHFCVNRPLQAITKLVGRVNAKTTYLAGAYYAPEMLRFDGANITQKLTNAGIKYFEIQYKFAVQTIWDKVATSAESVDPTNQNVVNFPSNNEMAYVGWNRLFRPDRGYWDYVRLQSDGLTTIYNPDTDIAQGNVKGFALLFHPLAI